MDYVLIACRVLVGLVFLLSAAGKLKGRQEFEDFRAATRALAPGLPERAVAPGVIVLELAVVTLLLFEGAVAAGFLLALGLLTAFTVGIAVAVANARQVVCACFGASSAPVGAAHLVRNTVLLLAGAGGLAAALTGTGTADDIAGAVTASVTGAAVAVMTLFTDDISHLFRPIH
ncbi:MULTISPECIES: MauE/DoxX family redox-associated membrane protein [Streptomyces]|uniref:MauE/DoxX family redox-associated membrane protein n=1 Tax=Streptomyces TaxID=1883 RepID=UPI0027865CFA|nr:MULTISPECIES: MauE/DoxX family redox-associated membrane protein [Streptomyces]MDQ0983117.1 hypothetical protein [Streptomyces sp. V2I9]MDW4903360.1 MauE/DoxX family redox-associated membrane protein [Streptomyces californicus]